MAKEIEHRFLVKKVPPYAFNGLTVEIVQGYLCSTNPTIRVRTMTEPGMSNKGFITIKGPKVGFTCDEYEYEIPFVDAEAMLKMCFGKIHKTRIFLPFGAHTIELDIFLGDLEGLIIAEIEVGNENVSFGSLPDWFGKDISTDHRYSNVMLGCGGIPKEYDHG